MRAFASSLHSWAELERNEGGQRAHGLTFPLAVLQAIGAPHGLTLDPEESVPEGPAGYDAIFVSVMDSRILVNVASHFAAWRIPFRRADRTAAHPLVWAGGQGLRNPMPLAPVADIIVLGDAEPVLPALLNLWERHGREGFLAAASTIPGVYVPAHHRPGEVKLRQAIADDISVTLREDVRVNHDGSRRVELARGCPYKCAFCSLGWRQPYRINATDAIIDTVRTSPRLVHLQAGDAESHPGIREIRAAMAERGMVDRGWTGRLDTVDASAEIAGNKRYAFGVEGISHRLRHAVGKGRLTDEYLIEQTRAVLEATDERFVGRAAWHLIAGLPSERSEEALQLLRVLTEIDRRQHGRRRRNLTLHWQPFQPLPGTPMQWFGAGGGARRLAGTLRGVERMTWLGVRQQAGRTDEMAKLCTVLSRSGERGADLLEALGRGPVTGEQAARIAGVGWGPLDPDAPLPWDWIEGWMPREALRAAFDVVRRRLMEKASNK